MCQRNNKRRARNRKKVNKYVYCIHLYIIHIRCGGRFSGFRLVRCTLFPYSQFTMNYRITHRNNFLSQYCSIFVALDWWAGTGYWVLGTGYWHCLLYYTVYFLFFLFIFFFFSLFHFVVLRFPFVLFCFSFFPSAIRFLFNNFSLLLPFSYSLR